MKTLSLGWKVKFIVLCFDNDKISGAMRYHSSCAGLCLMCINIFRPNQPDGFCGFIYLFVSQRTTIFSFRPEQFHIAISMSMAFDCKPIMWTKKTVSVNHRNLFLLTNWSFSFFVCYLPCLASWPFDRADIFECVFTIFSGGFQGCANP